MLVENIYNNFFLDSIRNQYLLSQGVYLNEEFDVHNQHLLLEILFTIAILFTQIVILNMLIAIMGDTFDRVNDRKALFAMQTKLQVMSDYHNIIKSVNSQQDFHNYLFIVQPLLDEEEQEDHEDWEGGINAVKKVLKYELRHLENRVINLETSID